MSCRIAIFVGLLVTVLPAAGEARDIFVNNQRGDDQRDGGTMANPCQTIGRALKLAQKGDRVILAKTGEPYRESVTLQSGKHSGDANQPFRLIGNGAVLTGLAEVRPARWAHFKDDTFRFRPTRMRHQLLYMDGKPAERVKGNGKSLPELDPLQWCLFDGHLYFRSEPRRHPRNYDLEHTALPVGITVYEARNVVVRDLIVQGFQLDGVNAHDSAMDTSLIGLVCRGNGRSGISVGGASRVKVVECVIGDNGVAQVRSEGFCKTEIIRSEVLDNTAPAIVREGGEVTVID